MRPILLFTFNQIYQEPIRLTKEYLAGIDGETLLLIASTMSSK